MSPLVSACVGAGPTTVNNNDTTRWAVYPSWSTWTQFPLVSACVGEGPVGRQIKGFCLGQKAS